MEPFQTFNGYGGLEQLGRIVKGDPGGSDLHRAFDIRTVIAMDNHVDQSFPENGNGKLQFFFSVNPAFFRPLPQGILEKIQSGIEVL